MNKSRITITISTEADQMLDELSHDQMRSRGAVVEMLIRAAHSGTKVCAPSHSAHTSVAQVSHPTQREVLQEPVQSGTPVAQEPRGDFHAAMLNLDEMCS